MAYSKLPIGKATMFPKKGNWKGSHRHFKSLLASSTSYSLPHPIPHNQTCWVENKKCLCFLPLILRHLLLEQNKQCTILLGSPQNMRLYHFSCLSATCCNVNFRGQSIQVNSREPLLDLNKHLRRMSNSRTLCISAHKIHLNSFCASTTQFVFLWLTQVFFACYCYCPCYCFWCNCYFWCYYCCFCCAKFAFLWLTKYSVCSPR